jgi:hypothetical protein
VAVR